MAGVNRGGNFTFYYLAFAPISDSNLLKEFLLVNWTPKNREQDDTSENVANN